MGLCQLIFIEWNFFTSAQWSVLDRRGIFQDTEPISRSLEILLKGLFIRKVELTVFSKKIPTVRFRSYYWKTNIKI